MAFNIAFHAVQAHHNDGTQSPCGEDIEVPADEPPSTDFEDEQDSGWQLFGDATTSEAQVVSTGGNPGAHLEGIDGYRRYLVLRCPGIVPR